MTEAPPSPSRPLQVARAVWAVVIVGLVVKQLLAPQRHTLYPQYAQTARDLAAGAAPTTAYGVQHLPYFADLLAAIAALPDRIGGVLWVAASVGVLLTGWRALVRRFASAEDHDHVLGGGALVLAVVGLGSLGNGQANVLITGCLLHGAAASATGRWWAAAAWLAVTGFKVYPWALGAVYAARFPRRFAGPFAAAVAACLIVPFALHPADVVLGRYQGVIAYLASGVHYEAYSFLNVRDALAVWGPAPSPAQFLPIQAATGAAIVMLLGVAARRGADEATVVLRGFLLTTLWFVTFGPSVEWQTYLLAAPALAWEASLAFRRGRPTVGLALLAAVVVIGPLHTSVFGVSVQRAVVGSKVGCWVLLAVAMRQVWLAPRVAATVSPAVPRRAAA